MRSILINEATITWNGLSPTKMGMGWITGIRPLQTLFSRRCKRCICNAHCQVRYMKRNSFPFNFGWGDHFPWNGAVYSGGSPDNRKSTKMITAGETAILGLEFSVSNGFQNVYKNGLTILSGPRSSPTTRRCLFLFQLLTQVKVGGPTGPLENLLY